MPHHRNTAPLPHARSRGLKCTLRRSPLSTATLLGVLCAFGVATATAGESGRWDGCGLGTRLTVSEQVREDSEGWIERRAEIIVSRRDSDGRLWAHRHLRNDDGTETQAGSVPPHLGISIDDPESFREIAQREETLDIGSATYPCQVTVYRSSNNGLGAPGTSEIELWRSTEVTVPPRALRQGTRGGSIRLDRDVLRARWTRENGDQRQEVESRIVDLAAPLTVDGEELECVREELTSTGDEAVTRVRWLHDQVPGYRLREMRTEEADGEPRVVYAVESYRVEPAFDPAAARGRIAAGERPPIPGPIWSGYHVGAWFQGVGQYERGGTISAERQITRVLALVADGYITEQVDLLGQRANDPPVYAYVDPARQPAHAVLRGPPEDLPERWRGAQLERTESGSCTVLGEEVPCRIGYYRDDAAKAWGGSRHLTYYLPTDPEVVQRMREAGLPWVMMRTRQLRNGEPVGRGGIREARLVAWNAAIEVAGERRSGALLEWRERDNESDPWRAAGRILRASAGPVLRHAEYTRGLAYGNNPTVDLGWVLVTDWGEADETPAEVDGRSLQALQPIAWVPFTLHPLYGVPVGTSLVYASRIDDGEEFQLIDRVEQVTWNGLVQSARYRHGMPDDPAHAIQSFEDDGSAALDLPALNLTLKSEDPVTLEIGDRTVPCRKQRWQGTIAAERWQMVRWVADDVRVPYRESTFGSIRLAGPSDMLKENLMINANGMQIAIQRTITDLDASEEALGETVTCVVEESSTRVVGQSSSTTTSTTWLSDEVPGGIVRLEEHQVVPPSEANEGVDQHLKMHLSQVVEPGAPGPALPVSGAWSGFPVGAWVRRQTTRGEDQRRALIWKSGTLANGQSIIDEESLEPASHRARSQVVMPVALDQPLAAVMEVQRQPFQLMWQDDLLDGTYIQCAPATGDRLIEYVHAAGVDGVVAPLAYGKVHHMLPATAAQANLMMQGNEGMVQVNRTCDGTREVIEVAGREIDCLRDEVTISIVDNNQQQQPVARLERWLSAEVPGHLVRQVLHQPQRRGRYGSGNREQTLTMQVVDFGQEDRPDYD